MYQIKRSDQEIDALLNKVADIQDSAGTAFPGESYENGIQAALEWVLGRWDDPPMEGA